MHNSFTHFLICPVIKYLLIIQDFSSALQGFPWTPPCRHPLPPRQTSSTGNRPLLKEAPFLLTEALNHSRDVLEKSLSRIEYWPQVPGLPFSPSPLGNLKGPDEEGEPLADTTFELWELG